MTKGFWLSLDLLRDKNTTMQEKLILIEISQLSMLDKGCIASNNHFAELLQVKKESISRSISSLENKGYITTKIKDGSRNHERVITINKMLFSINKMLFDSKQNVIDPLTNCLEAKENITINKTKNTKDINFLMFIDFLKEKVKHKSKVTVIKETKKLYEQIEDKKQLALDYINHQNEKDNYAVRITKFLEDYNTVYKNKSNTTNSISDWR